MTWRRWSTLFVVAVSVLVVAGCGGSSDPLDGVSASLAEGQVLKDVVAIDKAVVDGGDFYVLTRRLRNDVQNARDKGYVSKDWAAEQLRAAADAVAADCPSCADALDADRRDL